MAYNNNLIQGDQVVAKERPDILYELLAGIFRAFLVHGHVTAVLMVATLVPIVKNQLGSVTSGKNYRSIAISSLILKMFDWIILILHGSGSTAIRLSEVNQHCHVHLDCPGNCELLPEQRKQCVRLPD